MDFKKTNDQEHGSRSKAAMSYLIELQTSAGPLAYLVARADTQDHARALIRAHFGRDDGDGDGLTFAVHHIH